MISILLLDVVPARVYRGLRFREQTATVAELSFYRALDYGFTPFDGFVKELFTGRGLYLSTE